MSDSVPTRRHFASDNYAGICPEAFAAMVEANAGHEVSYGDDSWTGKAADLLRDIFEIKCEVYFVFNGTSANSANNSSGPRSPRAAPYSASAGYAGSGSSSSCAHPCRLP